MKRSKQIKRSKRKPALAARARVHIGQYHFGCRCVNLYGVAEENGGSFDCSPHSGVAEINIGLRQRSWGAFMSVVVHEAMEMAYADLRLRFVPCVDYASGSDGYIFHANHDGFSEACARVGHLLSDCIPDLSTVYRRFGGRARR